MDDVSGGSPKVTTKKGPGQKRTERKRRKAAALRAASSNSFNPSFLGAGPMMSCNSPMGPSGFQQGPMYNHNGPSSYQDLNGSYQNYGPNGSQNFNSFHQGYNGGPNYNNTNYNNGPNYNMASQSSTSYNVPLQNSMRLDPPPPPPPLADNTQKSQKADGPGPAKKARLNETSVTASVMKERLRIVPYRVTSYFIGRQDELKSLNNAIQACHKLSIDVTILGPLGSGKTQLALKFIEDNSSDFHHIIWISWENVEKTQKFFQNLATELQIQIGHVKDKIQFQTMMSRIFNILCRQKTILIFDNVNSQSSLMQFLPTSDIQKIPNMFVIVTSQHNNWESNIKITLDVFPYTTCVEFIKSHISSTREGDMKDLYELLDCSPIGLQTAVNLIKKKISSSDRSFKIDDFISKYNKDDKIINEMLKFADKFTNNTTLLSSMENLLKHLKLKASKNVKSRNLGEFAMILLSLLGLVDNADIPDSMFHSVFLGGTKKQCTEAFLIFENFFLIKYKGDKIQISKFFQRIINLIFADAHDENIIKLLTMFDKDIDTSKRYPKFNTEIFAIHAMKLWTESNLNDDIVKHFSKIPVAIVSTNWTFCKKFNTSSPLFLMLESNLGYGNVEFLQFINVITNVDNPSHVTNVKNSLTICETSLQKIPKELSDHKDALKLVYKSALLLNYLDKLEESWKLLEELYQKQCDKIGIDNEDTLETLEKMSEVAMKIFKKSGKCEILETCLSFIFQRFSNTRLDHVKSLCMMKYIPEYLHNSNKDEEALKLYDCLYETLETVNGSADVFTLQALMAKGECLQWLQKYDSAWDVIIQLNTKQISNKIDNSKTIIKLCCISNEIREDRRKKCWDFCFSLIEERIKKGDQVDQEQTLQILLDLMYSPNNSLNLLDLFDKFNSTLKCPFTHPLSQKTTYAKIDLLVLDKKFEPAWLELLTLYKQQSEHKLDTSRTLATMCQVACENDTQDPLLFQEWINIMNKISNFEFVLMVLEKIVNFNNPKTSRVLAFYDKLYATLKSNHGMQDPLALRTLLGKSWHMWCLDQKEAAWVIYLEVCKCVRLEPEQKTNRRWDFCNSLSKLIRVIKDIP